MKRVLKLFNILAKTEKVKTLVESTLCPVTSSSEAIAVLCYYWLSHINIRGVALRLRGKEFDSFLRMPKLLLNPDVDIPISGGREKSACATAGQRFLCTTPVRMKEGTRDVDRLLYTVFILDVRGTKTETLPAEPTYITFKACRHDVDGCPQKSWIAEMDYWHSMFIWSRHWILTPIGSPYGR